MAAAYGNMLGAAVSRNTGSSHLTLPQLPNSHIQHGTCVISCVVLTVYSVHCCICLLILISLSSFPLPPFFPQSLHSLLPQVLILVAQFTRSEDNLSLYMFWGIRLSVISVAINPFLYGLLARQYRMAYVYVLRRIFSCCCFCCVDPPLKDVFGNQLDFCTHVCTCMCYAWTLQKIASMVHSQSIYDHESMGPSGVLLLLVVMAISLLQ